jgi:rare lipoprotein A
MYPSRLAVLGLALLAASACSPAAARDDRKAPPNQVGLASFYGPGFQGEETASGESFDQREMTAAHRQLPLGSVVRVTNLENGRSVVVRINDRGPYGKNYRKGTVIDLSKQAARRLGFIRDGLVRVRIEVLRLPNEPAE